MMTGFEKRRFGRDIAWWALDEEMPNRSSSSCNPAIIAQCQANIRSPQSLLASIISVLAMTYSDNGHRDTLHYRIVSQSRESPGSWGNEYVRHLAAELGEEYNLLIREQAGMMDVAETQGETAINPEKPTATPSIVTSSDSTGTAVSNGAESVPAATTGLQVSPANRPIKTRQQLLDLALELVPFFLAHNAEADAVDLLLEVESIESLVDEGFLEGKKGEDIYARVCQYMVRYVPLLSLRQGVSNSFFTSCVPLLVAPDDKEFLRAAAAIYALHGKFPEALALAVRLRDQALVRKYFEGPKNPYVSALYRDGHILMRKTTGLCGNNWHSSSPVRRSRSHGFIARTRTRTSFRKKLPLLPLRVPQNRQFHHLLPTPFSLRRPQSSTMICLSVWVTRS